MVQGGAISPECWGQLPSVVGDGNALSALLLRCPARGRASYPAVSESVMDRAGSAVTLGHPPWTSAQTLAAQVTWIGPTPVVLRPLDTNMALGISTAFDGISNHDISVDQL